MSHLYRGKLYYLVSSIVSIVGGIVVLLVFGPSVIGFALLFILAGLIGFCFEIIPIVKKIKKSTGLHNIKKNCPKCGAKVSSGHNICLSCGYSYKTDL